MSAAAPLVLIGGGARSGKSRFALVRGAAAIAPGGRGLFVATAEPSDDEMRDRIARHRREREERAAGGPRFRTVEEPIALPEALAAADGAEQVVVVDCLTLWLSNLLVRGAGVDEVETRLAALVEGLRARRVPIVMVTNEVGMGLVPETPLGRAFRDVAGVAHQRLAAAADEIYFAALGTVVRLRPAPLALVAP
jgi:adenosylcobinamide kinase/adenosylcobinamide-phosphate guanylyltransferase